jgi:hypothetical protein
MNLSLPQRPSYGARRASDAVCHEDEPWREGQIHKPLLYGALATAGLLALYLGIVTLAESWQHAVALLQEDLVLVAPIVVGFGVQIGLFMWLRLHAARGEGTASAGALAGASGGTSTAAMVACCMHHVADVLPLLGFSAAAVFLAEYRIPFMIAGLMSNLAGILLLGHKIRRVRSIGRQSSES